jgi:hypothetical protein
MTLHKVIPFCTEWLSISTNITSKFHTTATFESFIKQNDSNKTCRHVHDLTVQNFIFLNATVHGLSPKNKI